MLNPTHRLTTVFKALINTDFAANTRRSPFVYLMLGERRRRWPSIKLTPAHLLVFPGLHFARTYGPVCRDDVRDGCSQCRANRKGSICSLVKSFVFWLCSAVGLQCPFDLHLHGAAVMLCKAERQYLFPCKINRYCFLALRGSVYPFTWY